MLALLLWIGSVKALGSSRTALYNCLTPVIAALVAWLVLGERPHPQQGLGALLVIAGVLVTVGVGSRGFGLGLREAGVELPAPD